MKIEHEYLEEPAGQLAFAIMRATGSIEPKDGAVTITLLPKTAASIDTVAIEGDIVLMQLSAGRFDFCDVEVAAENCAKVVTTLRDINIYPYSGLRVKIRARSPGSKVRIEVRAVIIPLASPVP